MEAVMGGALIGSVILGKPLLTSMVRKQQPGWEDLPAERREFLGRRFRGMTWRVGVFFWIHAALACWAAIYASTRVWALLKGVGFTLSFIAYLGVEIWVLRKSVLKRSPQVTAQSALRDPAR